jgi:hypothetical protein
MTKPRVVVTAASVMLAAVASSCGGESESKKETTAAGAAFSGQKAVAVVPGLNSNSSNNPTVSCPTGFAASKVIGAGGQVLYGPNASPGTRNLTAIIPTPSLNAVTAVGTAIGNAGGLWAVRPVAVCANPPPGLELVSAQTALDSSYAKYSTATCPAGKKVLGTGAQINSGNPNEVTVGSISPAANLGGVSAEAVEIGAGTNATWSLKVYAICATAPPGQQLVTADTPNDSSSPKSQAATCPAGKLVSGAGAKITSNTLNAITLTGMVPAVDLSGVSVNTSEIGAGTNDNWSLTAYAICV